jgi:2-phosphosulfolactate phosphatase
MHVQLFLTPLPLGNVAFEGKTVVVIDVLRSSTTICAMLKAGARGVIPTAEPGEAGEMFAKIGHDAAILAGERDGVKIENFQHGNSPAEFTPEAVDGKLVILCTTNGTAPFSRAAKAARILSGAFVNMSRLAEEVARPDKDVVIICSGQEGGFSAEDTLCGGMLIDLLETQYKRRVVLDDAASLALQFFQTNRARLKSTVAESEHGRFLRSNGFAHDVEMATEVDSMPVVAVLKDGRLVPVNPDDEK